MKLPVSVVIPTIPSRETFLREKCLPSVVANGDVEIIVVGGDENGNVKRNRGAAQATRPYLLFVDDDEILRPSCIQRMLDELDRCPEASFVYSDYERIVLPGVESAAPAGRFSAGPFDVKRLRVSNYINTTSLLRRVDRACWDERILRFQDWDFWLSVVLAGRIGAYVPEVLYELWQIDESVSSTVKANPYIEMIVSKHRLNL